MSDFQGYVNNQNQKFKVENVKISNFRIDWQRTFQELIIDDCKIKSLNGLEKLPDLRNLYINNCDIRFDYIMNLMELRCLNINVNYFIQIPEFCILNLPKLIHLDISNIYVYELAIRKCPNLNHISVNTLQLDIDDITLASISNVKIIWPVLLPRLPILNNLEILCSDEDLDECTEEINLYKINFSMGDGNSLEHKFKNYKNRINLVYLYDIEYILRIKLLTVWNYFFYEEKDKSEFNRFSYFGLII